MSLRLISAALLATPLAASSAGAAVLLSSGATSAYTHINAGGVVVADAANAPASGSGASAYDRTGGAPGISQGFSLASGPTGSATQSLHTGAVATEASAVTAPGPSATGTATLANVDSSLASKLLADIVPVAALDLTADAISSTSTAGIDGSGALFGTGSSSFAGLGLTGSALGLLTVDGSLYAAPAANTVLLSLAGLTVTLNEQLRTRTDTSLFVQTNAVHLALDRYALAGKLLSGDVILGHSEAQVTAVPEPGTWATMLMGFGAIGFALRGRRPAGSGLLG